MGCGCKKKKAQQAALNTAQSRTVSPNNTVSESEKNLNTIQEKKDYQDKVKDALKQLMDLKRRKRNVRF
tara:strand:+ start:1456 stop:1662 length:207 start_codon:yes stop_codon:yes gene_type:complete